MPRNEHPAASPRPFRGAALAAAILLAAALPAAAFAQPSTRNLLKLPLRSIDGTGNNVAHPLWGSANVDLIRWFPPAYGDGISSMSGADRPNPRAISNAVVAQPEDVQPFAHISNYIWMWGQFMDHDLDLTNPQVQDHAPFCADEADIEIPKGDPVFDANGTGTKVMQFCRSEFVKTSGTGADNPRQPNNLITAFIDASNVYGSDPERALELRKNDGSGELKTTPMPDGLDLLPYNVNSLPNADDNGTGLFLAGDVRSNENSALTSLHTLFVREHNYWARRIRTENRGLSDDAIYQMARAIVGAEFEAVTYNEFLPVLLGPNAIKPYSGYHPSVNPGIDIVFSTASYRIGHTLLTHFIDRLDANLEPIPAGPLALKDAFFQPMHLVTDGGIEPILRGAAHEHANTYDPFIVDDVRNFLFNDPIPGTFDLGALNIQRGRDHGLPGYNAIRVAYGLAPKPAFESITKDARIVSRLKSVYKSPDQIDPWVGGLAEPPVRGAVVGELVGRVLTDQFTRARDGDRFFYKHTFPTSWVNYFDHLKLSDVIRRNTPIGHEIQDNVFLIR